MRDHIKILGLLNLVLGSLTALAGIVAFLTMGTIAGFVAASLASTNSSDYGDGVIAAPIIASIGFGIALFFLVLGLPSIIGGWGLIRYRPWSRGLMIVVSILHLFNLPLGTALGAYGLWVLFDVDVQRILANRGYVAAAPGSVSGSYGTPTV